LFSSGWICHRWWRGYLLNLRKGCRMPRFNIDRHSADMGSLAHRPTPPVSTAGGCSDRAAFFKSNEYYLVSPVMTRAVRASFEL
jgi:hypothetical protein